MDINNVQAQASDIISRKTGLRSDAIYVWATNNKIDLVINGHKLINKNNFDNLLYSILNNTVHGDLKKILK